MSRISCFFRLVGYEIRKLCGIKYLAVMLAVVSAAAAGLFYYKTDAASIDRRYDACMKELAEKCARDPSIIETVEETEERRWEAIEALYEQMKAEGKDPDLEENYREFNLRSIALQSEFDGTTLGVVCSDGSEVSDTTVVRDLKSLYLGNANYFDWQLSKIIKSAEKNLRLAEIRHTTDTPAYEYERHFYDRFSAVSERVHVSETRPYGWGQFFDFDELGIFAFLYVTLAAGAVFIHERRCGTLTIIRTSENGRIVTTAAKLTALFCAVAFAVTVLTAAVFLTCALTFGFSSASEPVQSALGANCPYLFSMGGYAAVLLLVRVFAVFVFACLVALASSLTFSPIVSYAAGALIIVASLVINYFESFSKWLSLNLFGITTGQNFADYSELFIAGHYYPTLNVSLLLFVPAVIISAAVAVAVGGRRTVIPRPRVPFLRKLREAREAREASSPARRRVRAARKYSPSLFAFEMKKFLTPGVTVAVVLLFAASVWSSFAAYGEPMYDAERVRDEYVSEHLLGEITDSWLEDFNAHRAEVEYNADYERRIEHINAFTAGELTRDELDARLDVVDEYQREKSILGVLATEINELRRTGERAGVGCWLIPETMITRILGRDTNIFLLLAVLVLFSGAYDADFAKSSSGDSFSTIKRATARGRRASFRSKTLAVLVLSLAVTAAFLLADLAVGVAMTRDFSRILGAPLVSLGDYADYGGTITVGGYLALSVCLRAVSFVMLAVMTCMVSYFVRSMQKTLFVTVLYTLLPFALSYMGVDAMRRLDFTSALAGGRLLVNSSMFGSFGGAYAFAAIFMCVCAAITLASSLAVRRATGK